MNSGLLVVNPLYLDDTAIIQLYFNYYYAYNK